MLLQKQQQQKTNYSGSFSASLYGISNWPHEDHSEKILSHVNATETKPCHILIF